MKKTIIGIAAAGLLLAGCSSAASDSDGDNKINGMSRAEAAVACQKFLANNTPGVSASDFSTVSSKGIRKIRTGDDYHWNIQSDLDGRAYTCNVRPASADDFAVEGNFA